MSEYIKIDAELDDDGAIRFHTNLALTAENGDECYASAAEMEEGTPVAQALSAVEGIETLHMSGSRLVITFRPDADWRVIIADVKAALWEFFL
jgi:hypothetical protein